MRLLNAMMLHLRCGSLSFENSPWYFVLCVMPSERNETITLSRLSSVAPGGVCPVSRTMSQNAVSARPRKGRMEGAAPDSGVALEDRVVERGHPAPRNGLQIDALVL